MWQVLAGCNVHPSRKIRSAAIPPVGAFTALPYVLTISRMVWVRWIRKHTPPSGGWNLVFVLAPFILAAVALLAHEVVTAVQRHANASPATAAPTAAQRIITIAPNSAEIICALGACDAIVGVSKFCVYPPELQARPRVGGLFDPDLERIVALRPDLVVLRGRIESVEQLCRDRGIALYHDKTDTLGGIATCVTELGDLLDRKAEAAAVVKRFRGRLAAIRRRTADLPRPRVLLTVSRRSDRFSDVLTTGKGTFLTEMLEIAGGVNLFGHLEMAYPQVSAEAIVAHRPEVIIELMPEAELTSALEKQMTGQWHDLGPLPAVVQNRVFYLTDDHCLIPSLRYVEIIEKVSRILHPELDFDR